MGWEFSVVTCEQMAGWHYQRVLYLLEAYRYCGVEKEVIARQEHPKDLAVDASIVRHLGYDDWELCDKSPDERLYFRRRL